MNPLTVALIVALCGTAGGYLIGVSALFQDRRDRWVRRRDVYDAALHDELDDLEPAFGLIALDEQAVPLVAGGVLKQQRRRWRWAWRLNFMLACPVCSGWHFCWVALTWWAAVAWVTGGAAPVSWADALPVLGTAWAVHTVASTAAIKLGVWE